MPLALQAWFERWRACAHGTQKGNTGPSVTFGDSNGVNQEAYPVQQVTKWLLLLH